MAISTQRAQVGNFNRKDQDLNFPLTFTRTRHENHFQCTELACSQSNVGFTPMVYMSRRCCSIEDQWQQLAYNSLSFIQRDRLKNRISFRFILLADGSISNLKNLDSLDEFSLPAEICRQAIASRVPFGNWTPEMKDDFGESDTITIHFNYR